LLADYHIHVLSHGEYKYEYDWLGLFIDKAHEQDLGGIGFSEHDGLRHLIDFDLVQQMRDENPDIEIKMGLEIDYIPGREEEILAITAEHDWDYLIGSVHFINGWAFDHPDHRDLFATQDLDEIYCNYFKLLQQAVETRYFDIVGHLDLIKIWGHKPPKKTLLEYAQPVLETVKDAGMAVEVNTNGLRKPVREIYPAREIIAAMKAMDINILLSSDAHHPDQVGQGFEQAVSMVRQTGYRDLAHFYQRKMTTTQI
jgi:histidinol-phosphatase (PHP family)